MALTMAGAGHLDSATIEAIDWIVRLSSGEATDEDARALEAWRAEAPANDHAFRKMSGVRPVARALKKAPVVDRRAVLTGGTAVVAATAMFGLARPPLGLWPSYAELMADHRTGPDERYAFAPINGVKVEMNARTSIKLLGERLGIGLIDGEAFLTVDHGGLFRVEAGDVQAATDRGSFNVQRLASNVQLACLSGRLGCSRGDTKIDLGPRQQVTFLADGGIIRRTIEAAQAAGWRQGLLVFDGTPLAEVVERLNRYRPAPIVLTDDSLARRPVSGVFYTDQIEPAVTQLQQLLGLRLRHLPGGLVLMG